VEVEGVKLLWKDKRTRKRMAVWETGDENNSNFTASTSLVTISLFTWSKQKWLFWRAGFFPANQCILKTFQVLIGRIKPGPPKKQFLLWSCKQAKCDINSFWHSTVVFCRPASLRVICSYVTTEAMDHNGILLQRNIANQRSHFLKSLNINTNFDFDDLKNVFWLDASNITLRSFCKIQCCAPEIEFLVGLSLNKIINRLNRR